MERAERLRAIAETCRRIAGRGQEWRGENLRAIAQEFEERAAQLEAKQGQAAGDRDKN
jgi:hypothetical protein